MHLIIVQGPGRGQRIVLGSEPVHIGRDPSNDLIVDDTRASRKHAQVIPSGDDSWLLRDGGSRNGTLLNGEIIDRTILEAGDVIEIGDCRIAVHAVQEHLSTFSVKVDPESLQKQLRDSATSHQGTKSLQEALFEVGLLAQTDLPPEELVRQVVAVIRSGVHFESWGWIRWDDDTGPHAIGDRDGKPLDLDGLDPSRTLIEAARRRREGMISSQVGEAFEASVCLRRKQALSALSLPLAGRGENATVLYLERETGTRPFQAEELQWVAAVAAQLAVGLQNSRLFVELRQAHDELLASRELLSRQEKMAAIGRLASGFAHDLNNPLASVIGFLQLASRSIESSGDDSRTVKHLQRAQDAADFCRALCRNLLAFARTRPFKPGSEAPFPIAEAIEGTLAICEARLRDAGVTTEIDLEKDLVLTGDATALQQVIMNLVLNSADAVRESGQGTTITIQGRKCPDGGIELLIEDDGPGMPPEVAARAFDPLFTTKEADRGSGLGLFVVKRIVDGAGGEIELDTRPGAGTRFRVSIPDALAQLGSEEIDPMEISSDWQETT
ncbi:MAG: ATP-binding protein [Planctomycetota bacterium]